jgi:hypothetical protein
MMDEDYKDISGAVGSSYSSDTISINSCPPLTAADIGKLTASYSFNTMSSGSYTTLNTGPYNIGTTMPVGKITIGTGTGVGNGSSGQYLYSNGTSGTWATSSKSGLTVTGDADFEGDVKIKGVSLAKLIEQIQDRLAILVPDPAKLEKYEALKKAYNHYKLLEKLIGDDEDVDQ